MAAFNRPAPPRRLSAAARAAAGPIATRRDRFGAGFESEDTAEGAPEVRVKDGIDERVKETVDVAEPRNEADDGRRDRSTTWLAAERSYGSDDEERKPTDDERPGDDGQRPRRLPLPPASSSTFPVATQLLRVASRRRTSSRQDVHEILSVVKKHRSLFAEFATRNNDPCIRPLRPWLRVK